MIDEYSELYHFDRNRNKCGLLNYIPANILSKLLADHKLPDDAEGIFVELNLRKKKWLPFGSYHAPSQSHDYFFHIKLKKVLIFKANFMKDICC